MAASIAYYVLFSLFPLLIFIVGGVGLFLDEDLQRDIVDEVLANIPLTEQDGRSEVEDAIDAVSGSSGRAVGLIGLIGMAWAGSGMFAALRRSLNTVFSDKEAPPRPFVQQKLVDLSLVLALGVFFLASITVTTTLRIVRAYSEELAWAGDLAEALGFVWTISAYVIPLIFSFMAFMVLYTVVPSESHPPRYAWPGALLAAVLFELAKSFFGLYVENFRNFDVVFGSLGAVAAFMFWVYLSGNILLFGAEVAAVYPRVRQAPIKQPKLEGMGLPFRVKVFRFVKSLFVRDRPRPGAQG